MLKCCKLEETQRHRVKKHPFAGGGAFHFIRVLLKCYVCSFKLYRLNQALDIYLPIVFPHSVYGVPWYDKDLRDHLHWIKTEQLGWKMPKEKNWKK